MAITAVRRPRQPRPATPVQAAGDRKQARFAAAILAIFARAAGNPDDIRTAFEASPGTVQDVPDWSQFWKAAPDTPESLYTQIVLDAASADPLFGGTLSLTNTEAVRLAEQAAARLIVGISSDAREAIRVVLAASMRGDYPPRVTAQMVHDVVGLDTRRAQAVVNYRAGLERVQAGDLAPQSVLDDFTLSRQFGSQLSSGRVDQLVEQYSRRQLKDRANVIARTETMRAANDGQQAIWGEAADRGLFDRDVALVEWVITDEACDDCLENEAASPIGFGDSWPNDDPPVHPNCRCALSLIPGSESDG